MITPLCPLPCGFPALPMGLAMQLTLNLGKDGRDTLRSAEWRLRSSPLESLLFAMAAAHPLPGLSSHLESRTRCMN